MQRTGTTSTGQFFSDHGYRVAPWSFSRERAWTDKWFKGDFDAIFKDRAFKERQVFEDDPWWCGEFYRYLFHRFSGARFILLERDSDAWFDSMLRHSNGRTLGNTYNHCQIYAREQDLHALRMEDDGAFSAAPDNLLPLTEEHRAHYVSRYVIRNRSVRRFFGEYGPTRLFHGRLEDPGVWRAMGLFFSIDVADDYGVWRNASKRAQKSRSSR